MTAQTLCLQEIGVLQGLNSASKQPQLVTVRSLREKYDAILFSKVGTLLKVLLLNAS